MADLLPAELRSYMPRRYRRAELEQIAIEFPPAPRDYRWLFADGTRSAWRPAPARGALNAPPGARGLEWREPTGLKNTGGARARR